MTGSLGGLAGTQDVRGGDVLRVRTEVVRAAVHHERTTALCALHERAVLHGAAEAWRVVERADGTLREMTHRVAGTGAQGLCYQG